MVTTKLHGIRSTLSKSIEYVIDPRKTRNGTLVIANGCSASGQAAQAQFETVRKQGSGRSKLLAQHIIQSFAPGEITPEQAQLVGYEFCQKLLGEDYQYILATHIDHEHIHNHIIVNNTNSNMHRTFETEFNQGKKSERAWSKVRELSDEVCKKYCLSVIYEPEKKKAVSHFERDMQKEGKSWKEKLSFKIAEIVCYSKDLADFFNNCTANGIEYVYKPSNKYKLKFRMNGQERFTRAETLGEEYTAERIAEQIEVIQKVNRSKQHIAEMSKPRVADTPKPQVHKISEVKPSAPTPQVTEVKLSAPIQQILETKPTEKKIDVWADIRGMRNADEMISDLESAGVMSLDMFKSFMWNIHHDDDHSKDLPPLQEEINALNTLISKMKHIAEIEPIYKEYKNKSRWSQSRFKKKNADTIGDYEKTADYIKERRKPYYADGKPPTNA